MRPGVVWGIARAEMRLTRRLARYWVFVVLATLAVAWNFAWIFGIHYFISPISASAASANPRFFMGSVGNNYVLLFLFGLVFLGFDLRARDVRERMDEVLDTRPYSNLELVFGKAAGLLIPSWTAVTGVSLIVVVVGALLGNAPEPLSIIAFLLFMCVPGFTFMIGVVYFLTLLLRHRLLAALAGLAVIIGAFFVPLWWMSIGWSPTVDVGGAYSMPFPSDIIPSLIDTVGLLQRGGFLVAGIALLFFAAAIHPRRDDTPRAVRSATGGVLALIAIAVVGSVVVRFNGIVSAKERWLEAHRVADGRPSPDLKMMRGLIRIDPGKQLRTDLEVEFAAPPDGAIDTAVFTLNPGMKIQQIGGPAGSLEFRHSDGVLEVDLPSRLDSGETFALSLVAAGLPDPRFGYLDAVVEPLELTVAEAQMLILGYEPLVFNPRHVSLLPGLRWLPAGGTVTDAKQDFFTVDLEVDVPEGWLVAGPGKRRDAESSADPGRSRFRFAPGGWMPDLALVAGRYVSHAADVGGIRLEMLSHPKHAKNAESFADASGEIQDWLEDRLTEAADMGLAYPYDALTVVEVPNVLRGFGGGWRMDSTLIQPAMVLMRESGFPTARFDRVDWEERRDQEGGIPAAKRRALGRFFENDINGGNPFIAAARSFFGFQTASAGPGAVPLDFVWENLSSRVLAERDGYFSVHFFDSKFGQTFAEAAQGMNDQDRVSDNYNEVLVHMLTSTTSIWETALTTSLADLDPWEDPKKTINLLSLKGRAMAKSLLDELGSEKTGRFLGALRQRAAGELFTREDMVAAGQEVGVDLGPWLDIWIHGTAIPGFTVGDVAYHRVADDDDGAPRYQTRVTVVNGEKPPGLIRLQYAVETDEGRSASREDGETAVVPGGGAIEVGLITQQPLRSLRIMPYFSLNRDPFNVRLPPLDEERVVDEEPFDGTREVNWTPPEDPSIVVDDLDDGFAVEADASKSMFRFSGKGSRDEELDAGLPVTRTLRPNRWSRRAASDAYGKYRKTMAVVRKGQGKRHAIFAAELPESGPWRLDYYLPVGSDGKLVGKRGVWTMVIDGPSGEQEVSFDTESGEPGWNDLGTFELAAGEVKLRVSDETEGNYVVADAVRWAPAKRRQDQVAAR